MTFKLKIYHYFVVVMITVTFYTNVLAQTCTGISDWSPAQIYNGGDKAVLNGNLYQAKWWTQNENPNNPNAPWVSLGACLGSSSNSTACSGLSDWNSSTAYNGGINVIYSNKKYQAQWWTQGNQPGSSGAPWTYIGDCTTPVVSTVGTLTAFATTVGTPSAAQQLVLSGAQLTNAVVISTPNAFEISLLPTSGFSSLLVVNPSGGSLTSTTVYLRFNPGNTGSYSGNVTISSTGATTQTKAVSGQATIVAKIVCNDVAAWDASKVYTTGNEVSYSGKRFSARWWNQNATPSTVTPWEAWQLVGNCVYTALAVNVTTLNAFSTALGTPSSAQSLIVNGTELTGAIQLIAPAQFELSLNSSSGYSSIINLTPDVNNAVVNQTVYVRYNPSASGNVSSNISIQTNGMAPLMVSVSGTAQGVWQVLNNTLYNNPSLAQVGIGTSVVPDGYVLAVSGKIYAKGLKITLTGWPDYVFDKNYKLMPLSEVEKFIIENKHLPEVPAASIVERDGLEVGEMNKLLLQKVEEMTLYMIELEKKVNALELKVETK